MKDGLPSHTVVATGSPEVDQPALEQSTRMIWTRDTWQLQLRCTWRLTLNADAPWTSIPSMFLFSSASWK